MKEQTTMPDEKRGEDNNPSNNTAALNRSETDDPCLDEVSIPPLQSDATSSMSHRVDINSDDERLAADDVLNETGEEETATVSHQSFFSAEQLKSLLDVGRTAAVTNFLAGNGPLEERVFRIESLLEQFLAEGYERDRRMEETNRAMRSYFTDELGRLREAVTDELRIRAAQKLLQEVLPILNDMDDLLTRSEEAAQDEQTARLWRALEAYRHRFFNGLRRLGLEEIPVVEGETLFDPYIHECVSTVAGEQVSDGENAPPPGTIVGVRRRGYLFQNGLFQPPQVIIRGGE